MWSLSTSVHLPAVKTLPWETATHTRTHARTSSCTPALRPCASACFRVEFEAFGCDIQHFPCHCHRCFGSWCRGRHCLPHRCSPHSTNRDSRSSWCGASVLVPVVRSAMHACWKPALLALGKSRILFVQGREGDFIQAADDPITDAWSLVAPPSVPVLDACPAYGRQGCRGCGCSFGAWCRTTLGNGRRRRRAVH